MKLTRKYDLAKIMSTPNVAEILDENDCKNIANDVNTGYLADVSSRDQWTKNMAEANKLALQVTERKSEPWDGASNVKFPLVTIAALQFHARVYPVLIPDVNVAKCRIIGKPTQEKIERAERVATHMSWQMLEQDVVWEENHDKALLVEAIMGDVFKKSYFDAEKRYVSGEMVSPADLVVNYWCKTTVDMAPRATHVKEYSRNEIVSRVRRGYFCDYEFNASGVEREQTPLTAAREEREGITAPTVDDTTPALVYEQLCWYDLDGDGYAEPYIATVEKDGKMRRLVARFVESGIERNADDEIVQICPLPMYTRYTLIPAPDGGFYGLGFGRLLGPINDSVNTALNQLFDAGTLSNYGGGFLGRGARFRGGQYTFKPQEWKQVDSPGDDLRKNIVPLPVREPSPVLFQLLGFLVNYGERIASSNDLQVGENIGQNTPAETARTMNANGQRVMAAMYKRQWRAQRDELRVRYSLLKVYLRADEDYRVLATGEGAMVYVTDYEGPSTDVRPAADPTMVDDVQRLQNAEMVMGVAYKLPGFNKYLATRRWLETRRTPDIDTLYPAPPLPEGAAPGTVPDFPAPPDPKMLEIQIKDRAQKLKELEFQFSQQQFQIEMQAELMDDQRTAQLVQAQIYQLQAQATKFLAEAKGVETGHMVGMMQVQMTGVETQIRMLELLNTKLQGRIDEKLGKLKIIEAAVKTTGAVHGVKRKIEKAARDDAVPDADGRRPGEDGVAPSPTDEEASAALEGLGAGSVPGMG